MWGLSSIHPVVNDEINNGLNVYFRNLFLRQDQITQGNCQKDILRNAAMQEDDYFVAPIGNIPLHEIDVDYLAPRAKQHEN